MGYDSTRGKIGDKSLATLQDAILKASSALAMSINDTLEIRESRSPLDYHSVISKEIDAITLVGFVSKEILYYRKEAKRPSINPIYNNTNNNALYFKLATLVAATLIKANYIKKNEQQYCINF